MSVYRSPINSSQGPNELYTVDDIINDTTQFMIPGDGTGALEIFAANINGLTDSQNISPYTTYSITGIGPITLYDLLNLSIRDYLTNGLPMQTNAELTASGALKIAASTINFEFNYYLMSQDIYGWETHETNNSYAKAHTSGSVKGNTNSGINSNYTELYNTVAAQINSVVNSYNPVCSVFTPITIGQQLGSVYATANASCESAIQLAGEVGQVSGGTNPNLIGYNDLVTYWTEVNNQWSTVENEQIGTNLAENPDYIAMNTNLTNINTTCASAAAVYENYIASEMSVASAPAPFQRPPDTGVTTIINDTLTQYYETEMSYLKELETQLRGVLDYLESLNIPTVNSSSGSIVGSTNILSLNAENVAFSAPTDPPTAIVTINGNPGQQNINMVLSKGMSGQPGANGPTGNMGAKGVSGKDGPMGPPGVFEIPYQYYKS